MDEKKYKNEKGGDDYYIIPEKGSDAQFTGKQLIYRRGEFGETWRLIRQSGENEEERKHYADFELRDLKKDQVMYDKTVGAFVDGRGNKFSGKAVNERNNLVRAKANLVLKELKVKDPNYINKFMFSKSRSWNEEPLDDPGESDWAHASLKLPEELAEEKRKRFKKAIAPVAVTKSPEPKVELTLDPLYLKPKIKDEPSIEEIIKQRAKLRAEQSGIRGLGLNKSSGLNYLMGLDDKEII